MKMQRKGKVDSAERFDRSLIDPDVPTNGDEAPAKTRKRKVVKEPEAVSISIPAMQIQLVTFKLVGDAPLICHRFSEKAKKTIADKQQGKAVAGRQPKDPKAEYESCFYYTDDGKYGFPATAFKSAAETASTSLKGLISKTLIKQSHHVNGRIVEIKYKKVEMVEDTVRIGGMNKVADLRYRPYFYDWSITIQIRYNARALTVEQLVNLYNVAGFAVGIGEWRPEKKGGGSFGTFHVEVAK